jgi:hypothetical protein
MAASLACCQVSASAHNLGLESNNLQPALNKLSLPLSNLTNNCSDKGSIDAGTGWLAAASTRAASIATWTCRLKSSMTASLACCHLPASTNNLASVDRSTASRIVETNSWNEALFAPSLRILCARSPRFELLVAQPALLAESHFSSLSPSNCLGSLSIPSSLLLPDRNESILHGTLDKLLLLQVS